MFQMTRRWFVQVRGEDGLFRTVEDGEHANLSTAFAHYSDLEGVRMLLRGSHVVLRSDQSHTQPAHDALF